MVDTLAIQYCNIAGCSYEDGLKLATFERKHKAEFEEWYKTHKIIPARVRPVHLKSAVTKAGKGIYKHQIFGLTCRDHLGMVWPSKKDMCKAYHIPYETYRKRINYGWSVEMALTTPERKCSKPMADHLGHLFPILKAMCKHYHMSPCCYLSRRAKGWSLEKSLTDKKHISNSVDAVDHLGKEYSSMKEMCDAWGIAYSTFKLRQKNGISLKDSLTLPIFFNKKTKKK